MMKKQKLLNCVAGSVLLTGLGTSAAFAGGDGRDLGGYGADSYQPIAEAPRQYEESPDILSFGIQPEPAPVVAAAEPEPAPEPEAPFTVAMGGMNDLTSPCALDQTEEDSAQLKSGLDSVIASPDDEISAGCGNGVDVADLDKGIDYTDGDGPNGGSEASSLVNAGVIRAGGAALSGGDVSEIDSLLSVSAGDPVDDESANRPALIEATVGDNFLFGEDGQADPINVTVLDAINGDGTSVPEGGTSGTPLDALLDPVNAGTGDPGVLGLDLSGRPFSPADPDFDGLVEANLGTDEDPVGFNLVQVDAFDDGLTGGIGHVTVGDGLLDEGAGSIDSGDLGDNLVGVTLGPDPTGNENDNLAQVTLDNAAFGDLGDALGLRTAEVVNPDGLQTDPGLAALAGMTGPTEGALAPIVDLFRTGATAPGGGGTTGPTGTPLDAVLGPLADAAGGGGGTGGGTTGTPLDVLVDPLAGALGGGGGAPALPSELDPATLAALLGGGGGAGGTTGTPLDAAIDPIAGALGGGGGTTGPTGTPLDAVLGPLADAAGGGGGAPALPSELDPATLEALLAGGGGGGGTTGTPLDAALDPITAALAGGGGGTGGVTGTPLDVVLDPVVGALGI